MESGWIQEKLTQYSVGPCQILSMMLEVFMGLLFFIKDSKLCIPQCSLQRAIIQEAHGGGLARHFGRDKTLAFMQENFC